MGSMPPASLSHSLRAMRVPRAAVAESDTGSGTSKTCTYPFPVPAMCVLPSALKHQDRVAHLRRCDGEHGGSSGRVSRDIVLEVVRLRR